MAKTETSRDRCAICGKRMADASGDGPATPAGHSAMPAYGATAANRSVAPAGASDRASSDRAATSAGGSGRASAPAATETGAEAPDDETASAGRCCESCWRDAVASSTESVRTAIARRPGAPEWALTALAADPSPLVRAEVALRTDLTAEVVEALADPGRERDRTVLRRMARHPALGRRAWLLAALNDLVVQRQLARNPSTPKEVLTGLARHTDPTVSRAASARLIAAALGASEQERLPVGVRAFLAARPPGQR